MAKLLSKKKSKDTTLVDESKFEDYPPDVHSYEIIGQVGKGAFVFSNFNYFIVFFGDISFAPMSHWCEIYESILSQVLLLQCIKQFARPKTMYV